MRITSNPYRFVGLLAVLALAKPLATETLWAANQQKQVLVLYATGRDAQIVVVGDRELPKITGSLPEGVDYYSEFLDQGRFSDPGYQASFRDYLRLKYQGHAFDLVIAMDDEPLDFAARYRDFFSADTPLVFFSKRASPRRPPHSTGVVARLDLSDTLALATTLQPDVRRVFVVNGSHKVNGAYEEAARAQFAPYADRLEVTYLAGLPTPVLEARLASLPPQSIVYYLTVDRDGANQLFRPLDYLDRVTAAANAPVYSWVDSAMGHGIVGGSLKDQAAEVRAIGELAVRVLRGEQADSIPLSLPQLNVRQVDWRQLRRWRIAESRVPADTLVTFREPSAFDRYKFYVLGGITVLLTQSILIAGLLLHRARRRQAEARLRTSQATLGDSYERIRTLGARLLSAQESERSRIARELHDDISQQIALLSIDLEALKKSVPRHAEGLAGHALHRVSDVARSLHDLSHRLHPAKLQIIGLVSALQDLQREMSHRNFAITFTHDNIPGGLPHELTLCVFRIAQEALQNAAKHSGAHNVWVRLTGASGTLTLTVIDDGAGFNVDTAWGHGLGLVSINERAQAIGGTFALRSAPGTGTWLQVVVPLVQPEGGRLELAV